MANLSTLLTHGGHQPLGLRRLRTAAGGHFTQEEYLAVVKEVRKMLGVETGLNHEDTKARRVFMLFVPSW